MTPFEIGKEINQCVSHIIKRLEVEIAIHEEKTKELEYKTEALKAAEIAMVDTLAAISGGATKSLQRWMEKYGEKK